MHATLPTYVEKDLKTFVLFFVSPVQFLFDSKGRVLQASKRDIGQSVWKTTYALMVLSLVLGVMIPNNFALFPKRKVISFLDLFHWANLCNNYAMACKYKILYGEACPKVHSSCFTFERLDWNWLGNRIPCGWDGNRMPQWQQSH